MSKLFVKTTRLNHLGEKRTVIEEFNGTKLAQVHDVKATGLGNELGFASEFATNHFATLVADGVLYRFRRVKNSTNGSVEFSIVSVINS